jgi:hypothetical protein
MGFGIPNVPITAAILIFILVTKENSLQPINYSLIENCNELLLKTSK